MSDQWIRASEISEYVFCRRAWWLRRTQGYQSANVKAMQFGTNYHHRHTKIVQQAAWTRRFAYAALFVMVAVLVFQLLVWFT